MGIDRNTNQKTFAALAESDRVGDYGSMALLGLLENQAAGLIGAQIRSSFLLLKVGWRHPKHTMGWIDPFDRLVGRKSTDGKLDVRSHVRVVGLPTSLPSPRQLIEHKNAGP